MNVTMLCAFEDEMEKIAVSPNWVANKSYGATRRMLKGGVTELGGGLEGTSSSNLPRVLKFINRVSEKGLASKSKAGRLKHMAAGHGSIKGIEHSPGGEEILEALSKQGSVKIAGGAGEAIKAFAKKPGAVGAVVGGGLGGLKNIRSEMKKRDVEDFVGKKPEDLKKNRRARLKRMALSTAASAGTGALLGHFGAKGVKAVGEAAKKGGIIDRIKNVIPKRKKKGMFGVAQRLSEE